MSGQDTEYFIAVEQLQPGIYVYLDLGWTEHPFSFSSFKIKSADQIETLKEMQLKKVRYDPKKSDVRPLPPPTDKPAAAIVVPSAQEESPFIKAKRERVKQLEQQREAIERAEKQFVDASNTVRNISRNIYSRPKETIEDATKLIAHMAASILADSDVALHVMSDKLRSEDLYFHSLNVTVLSLMLAKEMKLPPEEIRMLGMGALFHDVGKSEIPDKILRKTDPLNKAETDFLQQHCMYGVDIAKKAGLPPPVIEMIQQHHELNDGSGYPHGLRGEQITTLSGILCIVNTYDNLCNHINIANSLTPHEALSIMFAKQRAKYASAALGIFIRCLGVYPPGTVVKLSNESLAIVTRVSLERPLKPVVLVYDPQVPKEQAILVDLEKETDLNISNAIRPGLLPRNVYEYLSPRKRVSYYFDAQKKEGAASPNKS